MKRIICSIIVSAIFCFSTSAEVKLPPVFSDNMVLQQKTDAAIWGTASPGKKVTIRPNWGKQKYCATADPQSGKWFIRISTPEAGGPYEISISDGDAIVLKNVLIGEVWFCSGQSNMAMTMKGYESQPVEHAAEYIMGARPSRPIRICQVERCSSTVPADTIAAAKWCLNRPSDVATTSATAYFFAHTLEQALNVPVGIITSSWGGSSIQTWIDRETIERVAPEISTAHLEGKIEDIKYDGRRKKASLLYNGQVHPLEPFTVRGFLWYQGETNRAKPEQYIRLQTAYAEMMRNKFEVPDAPFLFVQIAPYKYNDPNDACNGYFTEAQAKTLETIPNSSMVVTADIGDRNVIHPSKKLEVGQRLAYLALQSTYGVDEIEVESPTCSSMEINNGEISLKISVDEKKGIHMIPSEISGFEVAGDDKVFYPAKAKVTGTTTIVLSCDDVKEPVAVRYCFKNWCKGTIFNNYGIPLAPFRTDNW